MSAHPVVNRRQLVDAVYALTRAINPGPELAGATIVALHRVLNDLSAEPCQLVLLTQGDVIEFGDRPRQDCMLLRKGHVPVPETALEAAAMIRLGQHYFSSHPEQAPRPPRVDRFTCAGKGGAYERLGFAKPAGAIKAIQGDSGLVVYRDEETGQLYFRDPADFAARMERVPERDESVNERDTMSS